MILCRVFLEKLVNIFLVVEPFFLLFILKDLASNLLFIIIIIIFLI